MAMIKCKECGKEFSDFADACPNCGCPVGISKGETTNGSSSKKRGGGILSGALDVAAKGLQTAADIAEDLSENKEDSKYVKKAKSFAESTVEKGSDFVRQASEEPYEQEEDIPLSDIGEEDEHVEPEAEYSTVDDNVPSQPQKPNDGDKKNTKKFLFVGIAAFVVIVIIALIAIGSGDDEKTDPNAPKYDATIYVECEENILFSRYDVDVSINDENIGTIKHGESDTLTCKVVAGENEVVFESTEEAGTKGTGTINVKEDGKNSFGFSIACKNDEIKVEKINMKTKDAENAISGLEGKTIKDAVKVEEKYGYTFTYYDSSYDDITKKVSSDSKEYETIEIDTVEDIDTSAKTAAIYTKGSTEEDVDESSSTSSASDISAFDVGEALEQHAKYNGYPYGFKVHSMTDAYAFEKEGEDEYYLKAGCTVENEYGNKAKMTVEGCCKGKSYDDLKVTYFIVY